MRLHIFRRPEHDGRFSYLALPEGKLFPQEATNTEWQAETSVEVDDGEQALPDFAIEHLAEQIASKGYAVTSVTH